MEKLVVLIGLSFIILLNSCVVTDVQKEAWECNSNVRKAAANYDAVQTFVYDSIVYVTEISPNFDSGNVEFEVIEKIHQRYFEDFGTTDASNSILVYYVRTGTPVHYYEKISDEYVGFLNLYKEVVYAKRTFPNISNFEPTIKTSRKFDMYKVFITILIMFFVGVLVVLPAMDSDDRSICKWSQKRRRRHRIVVFILGAICGLLFMASGDGVLSNIIPFALACIPASSQFWIDKLKSKFKKSEPVK